MSIGALFLPVPLRIHGTFRKWSRRAQPVSPGAVREGRVRYNPAGCGNVDWSLLVLIVRVVGIGLHTAGLVLLSTGPNQEWHARPQCQI